LDTHKIVLASTSPRRIELLRQLGLDFECFDPGNSENSTQTDPVERVKENAEKKATSALEHHKYRIVIAADTIVLIDGVILEKPKDRGDAVKMLSTLSGRTHKVLTAIAVVDSATGKRAVAVEETLVKIKELTREEIESYVDSGEPLDKAGAYAAQGLGAVMVERIDGCFYNVVGLPLSRLHSVLLGFGIDLFTGVRQH